MRERNQLGLSHTGDSPMSSRTIKRLLSELQEYNSSPPPGLLHLAPASDDDLLAWEAHLTGPPDTAWHGESVQLQLDRSRLTSSVLDRTLHLIISIPTAYPAQPPTISFRGRVFHPNVHYKVGLLRLYLYPH